MTPIAQRLRSDIQGIVNAAIRAVQPEALLTRRISVIDDEILVDGRSLTVPLKLGPTGRVVIVGGGKAAAGMASGVADVFSRGARLLRGLVSVPEGCGRTVSGIEVRETRPAAENLPTAVAVTATREMLGLVGSLGADDTVIAVISGGGSALLAAPRPGVPLAEKVAIAKFLTAAGAPITDINIVRQAASDVKGGGLARACLAGRMLVLVLSDVIGDPLDAIASGPCMPVDKDAATALAILDRYGALAADVAPELVRVLRRDATRPMKQLILGEPESSSWKTPRGAHIDHVLLGSNATAVDAAATEARRVGYRVTVRHANPDVQETADEVGQRLARDGLALAHAVAEDGQPRAVIEGGEAVVKLPVDHGVGGRNQQTVVAALAEFLRDGQRWPDRLALASLGTDGEDGPTRAAGGLIDTHAAAQIAALGLEVNQAVRRCAALPLLQAVDGLVATGPTGTNVADVRVILAWPGPG